MTTKKNKTNTNKSTAENLSTEAVVLFVDFDPLPPLLFCFSSSMAHNIPRPPLPPPSSSYYSSYYHYASYHYSLILFLFRVFFFSLILHPFPPPPFEHRYGLNHICILVPPLPVLFMREVFQPFFVFQIFSVILWCAEEYYTFAACIFVIGVYSIAQVRT